MTTEQQQIIKQTRDEFAPFLEEIEKNPYAWTDEMNGIIFRGALKYGITQKQIDGNFPEYLSFFEQVTL
jgi:hypothetical protein